MSTDVVAMVCDAGFLPYAAYLASRIDRLHPDRDFDLAIVGPGLSDLPAGLGDIGLHRFDRENPFAHRDLSRRRSHASYLCLMLPDLLPHCRRILYLDCDVLPNAPIAEVFGLDLHGAALGAVRDAQQWRTPRRSPAEFARLRLPPRRYLNSGVLLFDAARWRHEGLTEACVAAARDPALADGYVRNDQSAVNLALKGRWTELSPVWNWQWTETTRYAADDAGARLVHFIGPKKPWRSRALPPRFTAGYAAFLGRHFPDAPRPPAAAPRVDRHRRALARHWLRAAALQRYLDRFETPLATIPSDVDA